jgi:hypothetical protein
MAAEAVTGALDANDDGVVEEAIQQRCGDDGVAEHPEMPLSSNGWFRVLPSQILAMPYSGRPSSCCRWAVVGVQGSSRWRCRMGAGA